MANPTWFNEEDYLASKLEQLKQLDSAQYGSWNTANVAEALQAAGYDNAYDHFAEFGAEEGTSPNKYFNVNEYLANKAAQLNEVGHDGRTDWTAEDVALAFDEAGTSPYAHFSAIGWDEGVNPSSTFDVAAYLQAKADQLNGIEHEGRTDWTAADVKAVFKANGLDPIGHYEVAGRDEEIEIVAPSDNQTLSQALAKLAGAQQDKSDFLKNAATNETLADNQNLDEDSTEDDVEVAIGAEYDAQVLVMAGAGGVDDANFGNRSDAIQDALIAGQRTTLETAVSTATTAAAAGMTALLTTVNQRVEDLEALLKELAAAEGDLEDQVEIFETLNTGLTFTDGTTPAVDDVYVSGNQLVRVTAVDAGEVTAVTVLANKTAGAWAATTDGEALLGGVANLLAAYDANVVAEAAVVTGGEALAQSIGAVYVAEVGGFAAYNPEIAIEVDYTDPENPAVTVDWTEEVGVFPTREAARTDDGTGNNAVDAAATDAGALALAMANLSTFNERAADFENARELNNGLADATDAITEAREAITLPEDEGGLGLSLLEGGDDFTINSDVYLFSATDSAGESLASFGARGEDKIFFGEGFTLVGLGESDISDGAGQVDVLEIFWKQVGDDVSLWVELEAFGGNASGPEDLVEITLTGVNGADITNDLADGFLSLGTAI